MADINSSLAWFYDRLGKVTYSMTYRNGPSSYDCSSAVYYALIQGGFFPASTYIGNTESLFNDLERLGWTQVPADANDTVNAQRGDIFIWGVRGQSAGAFGHTGMFVDANNIIHCSYVYNGIHVDNHDWLSKINGYPHLTVYRYSGFTPQNNPTDQILEKGSTVQFSKVYRADDVQMIDGIWQVRTNELCRNNFTWEDNGIPAEPLVEVDLEGYRTPDQELNPGSLYVIPGKFTVLDIDQVDGMWLGQFEMAGVKFWADVETLTEIRDSDPGKASPAVKPAPVQPSQPVIVTPPVAPPVIPPVVTPPTTVESQKDKEQDQRLTLLEAAVKALQDLLTTIVNTFKNIGK